MSETQTFYVVMVLPNGPYFKDDENGNTSTTSHLGLASMWISYDYAEMEMEEARQIYGHMYPNIGIRLARITVEDDDVTQKD